MEFQTLVISSILTFQTKDLRFTEILSYHLDFFVIKIIHYHIYKLYLFQIIKFLKLSTKHNKFLWNTQLGRVSPTQWIKEEKSDWTRKVSLNQLNFFFFIIYFFLISILDKVYVFFLYFFLFLLSTFLI